MTPRDAALLPPIQALKAAPPFWGARRLRAYPRCGGPLPVKAKRVLRLRRAAAPSVTPQLRLKATRPPMGGKPQPTKPDEWWGSEMTEALVDGSGWVDSVPVPDG